MVVGLYVILVAIFTPCWDSPAPGFSCRFLSFFDATAVRGRAFYSSSFFV